MIRLLLLLAVALLSAGSAFAADDQRPAKQIFGAVPLPANLQTEPIGFYARGCLAGAVQLPPDGPHWQVMRLSRNRDWGMPQLVSYLEWLSDAAAADGWPGLLIGDMSMPRGGPMPTGHASHQIGLDVDIWLTPMPGRRLGQSERETMPPVFVTEGGPHLVYPNIWTDAYFRLLRRAASDGRVDRIFVAPGIKEKLCQTETGNRSWLAKIRPWFGHNDHFHVRLACPRGAPCREQEPPPSGDGCGAELQRWFTPAPYAKGPGPTAPQRQITLADLPPQCAAVLAAPPKPGTETALQAFGEGK